MFETDNVPVLSGIFLPQFYLLTLLTLANSCVINRSKPRWKSTPIPTPYTTVQVMSRPYQLAQNGVLYVEVESLVLNIGPPSLPSAPSSVDRGPPAKRRKFATHYEPPPAAPTTTANPVGPSRFVFGL